MEKFGIYQILEALGRMNGTAGAPASSDSPPREAPPPPKAEPKTPPEESPFPEPSYFNAKIREVMENHDRISKRIDRDRK